MRSAFIYVVQILRKKTEESFLSRGRTVKFIHGRKRRTVVVVIHINVGIIILIFCTRTFIIWFFNLKHYNENFYSIPSRDSRLGLPP